jgi:dipeptidyl aminopeptidase/acylaminoacyl peptidase
MKVIACLVWASAAYGQQQGLEQITEAIQKQGCTTLQSGVKVCRYDYTVDGRAVEALSFRPAGEGRFPGVLMIPGYSRTAWNLIPLGVRLAGSGFAGVGVSQPGFGKSNGPADYVGPKTLKVLMEGYRKLQREPYVDEKRMGIYGFSRGGMAASLLAVELDDVRAAVFGAGIYDFKRAHDEVTLPGIRENMMAETGMTAEAIRARSSVQRMDRLKCPVLILHGEKDVNVPVSQAVLLRERLKALGRDFEIKLFPDREHGIGPEVTTMTLDFFERRLK